MNFTHINNFPQEGKPILFRICFPKLRTKQIQLRKKVGHLGVMKIRREFPPGESFSAFLITFVCKYLDSMVCATVISVFYKVIIFIEHTISHIGTQ